MPTSGRLLLARLQKNPYFARIGRIRPRDGNMIGQSSGGATTSYTFDAENQLAGIQSSSGSATSFLYDPLGNLYSTTENGQTTQDLVDPSGLGNVVAQFNASGDLIADYTYGLGLVSTINSSGTASYFDFDALGSTADLTNTAGGKLDTYSYLPFGEILTASGGLANAFQFVGEWGIQHVTASLDSMRARSYNVETGKFLAIDPLGLASGDFDLTRYARNNPLTSTDPSGLDEDIYGLPYDPYTGSVGSFGAPDNEEPGWEGSQFMTNVAEGYAAGYAYGMMSVAGMATTGAGYMVEGGPSLLDVGLMGYKASNSDSPLADFVGDLTGASIKPLTPDGGDTQAPTAEVGTGIQPDEEISCPLNPPTSPQSTLDGIPPTTEPNADTNPNAKDVTTIDTTNTCNPDGSVKTSDVVDETPSGDTSTETGYTYNSDDSIATSTEAGVSTSFTYDNGLLDSTNYGDGTILTTYTNDTNGSAVSSESQEYLFPEGLISTTTCDYGADDLITTYQDDNAAVNEDTTITYSYSTDGSVESSRDQEVVTNNNTLDETTQTDDTYSSPGVLAGDQYTTLNGAGEEEASGSDQYEEDGSPENSGYTSYNSSSGIAETSVLTNTFNTDGTEATSSGTVTDYGPDGVPTGYATNSVDYSSSSQGTDTWTEYSADHVPTYSDTASFNSTTINSETLDYYNSDGKPDQQDQYGGSAALTLMTSQTDYDYGNDGSLAKTIEYNDIAYDKSGNVISDTATVSDGQGTKTETDAQTVSSSDQIESEDITFYNSDGSVSGYDVDTYNYNTDGTKASATQDSFTSPGGQSSGQTVWDYSDSGSTVVIITPSSGGTVNEDYDQGGSITETTWEFSLSDGGTQTDTWDGPPDGDPSNVNVEPPGDQSGAASDASNPDSPDFTGINGSGSGDDGGGGNGSDGVEPGVGSTVFTIVFPLAHLLKATQPEEASDIIASTNAASAVTNAAAFESNAPVPTTELAVSAVSLQTSAGTGYNAEVASFTGQDPSATDYTCVIGWGDGKSSLGFISANGDGGFDVFGLHAYAKAAIYPVSITVTDFQGGIVSAETSDSVVPSLSQSTISIAPATVQVGSTATVTMTARDFDGNQETYGGWAVGLNLASGTGTLSAVHDNGDGTYTATFIPRKAGNATITATIDGQPLASTETLTVGRAAPNVTVVDVSASQSGNSFPAMTEVAGVISGVDATPAASLEGVAPTLAYYSGTLDAAQVATATPLPAPPTKGGIYTVVGTFPGSQDYTQATSAPVVFDTLYDLEGDGKVGNGDYALFSTDWHSAPGSANWNGGRSDFEGDGTVGNGDYAWFSSNWRKYDDDPTMTYPSTATGATAARSVFAATSSTGSTPEIDVQLVPVTTVGASDTTATLPSAVSQVAAGGSFYVEVWAENADGTSNGITGADLDISFDPTKVSAGTINHGSIYDTLTSGTVNNTTGVVTDFSGNVSPDDNSEGVIRMT